MRLASWALRSLIRLAWLAIWSLWSWRTSCILDSCFEPVLQLVVDLLFFLDGGEQVGLLFLHIPDITRFPVPHRGHRHVVDETIDAGKDDRDLDFNRQRLVLVLLEQFHDPRAAAELGLGVTVEFRAELRERREVAVLREFETNPPATWRIALVWALPPTRETERPTLIAGR